MRPCNTLAIFNRICNGMGTEIRSDEINQAITSKTHVKPKATKSFKNVLILYHKKSLYMRIIKYYIAQCLKITEKSLIQYCELRNYVYILSGQKFIKYAKHGQIGRVFKNLNIKVKQCYQTGHFL